MSSPSEALPALPMRLAARGPRYAVAPAGDLDALAALVVGDPELCEHLGIAVDPPGLEERARRFLARSDLVLAVTHRRSGRLAGAVTLSRIDLHSRHAFLATFAAAEFRGGLFVEAVLVAIERCFSVLGLQRVRFDVLAFNRAQFARVERYAELEGIRRDWLCTRGRYWDVYLYAIPFATWVTTGRPMARRLMARA